MNDYLQGSELAVIGHNELPEVDKPGDATLDDPVWARLQTQNHLARSTAWPLLFPVP